MKKLILTGLLMAACFGIPASAGTIVFTAPSTVQSAFDVVVQATNVFAGRDTTTDGIISYGFNLSINNPATLSFLGATSGPDFDAATTEPGTNVFGAASGFGVFPPVVEPLTLVTLHFLTTGVGPAKITITSDLSNGFQGLQYFNSPFQESIAGVISVNAVPEPASILLSTGALLALGLLRRMRR